MHQALPGLSLPAILIEIKQIVAFHRYYLYLPTILFRNSDLVEMGELYASSYVEKLRNAVIRSLAEWGFSPDASVSLLTVSENATFRITDNDEKRYVVRVHRPHYHTQVEIESELLWIESLRINQIVVTPKPLPLVNGGTIATFNEGSDVRHMVAFEFMSGEEPSTSESLSAGFRQLGAITAKLHQHTRQWTLPEGFTRKTWNFETTIGASPHWGQWQDCPELTPDDKALLRDTVTVIKAKLDDFGCGSEKFGLIHADLRLANLLEDNDRLAVIDFDDCGFGWYAYDFAAAISFIEEDPQVPALLQAWVAGYREVAELGETDEQMIPTFIMLRRLMLTAWLNTHSETPTAHELGVGFVDGTLRMARNMMRSGTPLNLEACDH